jgi:hypothetical protein
MRQILAEFKPDRVTSSNPTRQILRAPAARGARNKGCYFWTRLAVGPIPCQVLLLSERLGKSNRPIDVANLMGQCITCVEPTVSFQQRKSDVMTSFGHSARMRRLL